MSIVLIAIGAMLVVVALFNRIPRIAAPQQRGVRLRTVPARLTETGRATLTAVGGSTVIIALFLALSGL